VDLHDGEIDFGPRLTSNLGQRAILMEDRPDGAKSHAIDELDP
jgi:hypothetical protein